MSRLWYLAFYSVSADSFHFRDQANSCLKGNQLRRDLNVIIGSGKNWNIPTFWPVLLRYVSGPILAIVYGFSYPAFYKLRYDPLHILGFGVGHIALLIIFGSFIFPRWYDLFIPAKRQNEGKLGYAPNVTIGADEAQAAAAGNLEEGHSEGATERKESPISPENELITTEEKRATN